MLLFLLLFIYLFIYLLYLLMYSLGDNNVYTFCKNDWIHSRMYIQMVPLLIYVDYTAMASRLFLNPRKSQHILFTVIWRLTYYG